MEYMPANRENAEEKRRGKEAAGKALGAFFRALPMAAAFFLFSLISCFSVSSPFSVCCLMALLGAGIKPYGAAMGLTAALGYRAVFGLPLDAGQYIACAACLILSRYVKGSRLKIHLCAGVLNALRVMPGIFSAQESQTVILHVISAALGVIAMPALLRAAEMIKSGKKRMNQDEALCLLLPFLLMVAGAGRLSFFRVNAGYLLSCFTALSVSWIMGCGAGMAAGLGCGLSLLLGGQSALPMVNLAFGALMGGLFRGKKRLWAAGAYLLAAVVTTYLVAYSFQLSFFLSEGTAALLFCLTPPPWTRRLLLIVRQNQWNPPRENAYVRHRMQRWVRSIEKLSDELPNPGIDMPTPREETDILSQSLCADCDRLPICWHDEREETLQGMEALCRRGEDPEEYVGVINQYFFTCPRIAKIPEILRLLDDERRKRTLRNICAGYERDMLQTHLTALSQAAQRISLEGDEEDEEEERFRLLAEEGLVSLGFPGGISYIKRVDGKICACVQSDAMTITQRDLEEAGKEVGLRLGVRLQAAEIRPGRIELEEAPPLKITSGMATACAVTRERKRRTEKKPDNGDAVMVKELWGGREMLALSDGMGHGAGAQEESKKTLEMLRLCLEAGYSRAQAMTAVNGVMLGMAGGEKFATVDLCLIDLWTGEAALNKLGACTSYLIQGQKIRAVEGAALPLGIIERVVPMEHRVTLGEGDLIVMMSDGISDAFDGEEELISCLRRSRDRAPQLIADALLREASQRRNGQPSDDMTALCARISARDRMG